MYSRLLDFLETFKIIYDNQFGFRKQTLYLHGFNDIDG